MVRFPFCLWLLFASVTVPSLCELFSSMAHLQTALYAERDIASEIRKYVQNEKERLKKLETIADEFESHSTTALQDPDFYLGNPVNAYLFVKHFTLDWDRDIEKVLKNNSREELYLKVLKLKRNLPTYEDLTGSVSALLRLQDTYQLDVTDIAQGNVGGTKSTELSVQDCFEIGRLASENEDYYHTALWMGKTLTLNIQTGNTTLDPADIIAYLAFAEYKQGNVRRALTLTNELLTIQPDNIEALRKKADYLTSMKEDPNLNKVNQGQLDRSRHRKDFNRYEALCRGEHVMENKHSHSLVCRYRNNNNNPLMILSPAKEEELFKGPYISLFHDAIHDKEIQMLKTIAIPKLIRATVNNPDTAVTETAPTRVSKTCWLWDKDSDVVRKISERIGAITGLNMDTADALQVNNYGIGGQYEPHHDFNKKGEKSPFPKRMGNRLATFMFYMSDVKAGGATVFPHLGLKIFPQKGTAVLWYNLYRNGDGQYDTLHAGCPVLVGSKWVSNKWIHERGQLFRRQCGLNSED